MKFRIRKEKLMYALNNVQHAVSSKSTIAVLEGIFIKATDNKVEFRGSDMDLFIETDVEADVEETGELVVDASLFIEMIKRMPDDTLYLVTENDMLLVKCKKIEMNVVYMDSKDYPTIPKVIENSKISVPQKLIKDMIKATSFAVALDESRPILQGILFEVKNKKLNLVALDGYRLAIRSESVDVDVDTEVSAVIMGKNFLEVSKMFENKEDVTVSLTKNQIMFELGETKIVSRLLEGKFVEYGSLLPKESKITVKINKNKFAGAIERASLVGKSDKSNVVKIEMLDDKLLVTSNSSMGKVKEEVEANIKGEGIKMAFNPKYVLDILRNIDDEEIEMEFNNPNTPCVITNEKSKYLVLPVRLAS